MTQAEIGTEAIEEPAKTIGESVYRRLRSDIIWGKLPPGAPLRFDELRKRYAAGITPLREALSRLTSERLATSSGQRGFRVAPIGADSVVDVTETRIVIESAALKKSIEVGDVNWETRVVATHHSLSRMPIPARQGSDNETWSTRHKGFHMALLSACGSEWQMHLANLLFDQAGRFRILRAKSSANSNEGRNPAEEHQNIFEAALDRDADACVSALAAHYRATMNMALDVLAPEDAAED